MSSNPSQDRIRYLFDYDPETGVMTRRVSLSPRTKVGDIAGHLTKSGYLQCCVDGVKQYIHRLAWLYVHGEWPKIVDHVNHNKLDNRISNLRNTDKSGNSQNLIKAHSDSTSGYLGVSWYCKNKKWRARITKSGNHHLIGYYDTPEEASAAYLEAKKLIHDVPLIK